VSVPQSDLAAAPASRRARIRVRRRWIVAALVLVVAAGVVGYLGVGYLAYDRLSAVSTGCGTRDFRSQTPADFEAYNGDHSLTVDTTRYRFSDVETVAFPARGTPLTIRGWYAPGAAGSAGPTVILVHGRDSCRRDPVVMLPAGMLHAAGFGVLLIDMRNHGDSDVDDGRWAGGSKEFRDVLGAWDWLVARGVDPSRIGLFGASLGAGTVTIATGEEPRVAATWADSGYYDVDTAAREYAESQGYPGWVWPASLLVGRLLGESELGVRGPDTEIVKLHGRPFAIVEGLSDTTVRPHHAVDLAAAAYVAGTSVEPWIIPGAGHTQGVLLRPDEYASRLIAFFAAALGAPAAETR
jgi:dipeptidyl aminopeptidase/acylaminoacyl peptidase